MFLSPFLYVTGFVTGLNTTGFKVQELSTFTAASLLGNSFIFKAIMCCVKADNKILA
jgi:hypothetical protein